MPRAHFEARVAARSTRARDDFTRRAPRIRPLDVVRARHRRGGRGRGRGVEIRARARGIHESGRRLGIARGDGAVGVLRRPRPGGRRVRAVAVVGGDDVGGLGAQGRGDGGRGVGVVGRREIVGKIGQQVLRIRVDAPDVPH